MKLMRSRIMCAGLARKYCCSGGAADDTADDTTGQEDTATSLWCVLDALASHPIQ